MKDTPLKLGLPYFFRKRLQGRISLGILPVTVSLESKRRRSGSLLEDILRWADDGGQMPEPGSLLARSNPDTARKSSVNDGVRTKSR